MLALRYHPGEEEFILEENIPRPVIENEDDVLVKVEYAGLCGTDIHIVQGEFGNCSIEPITLGHEFSGVVIDSGVNVMLKTGTAVAIDPNSGCKRCQVCLNGKYHFCRRNQAVGVKRDGGFARYCVVPAEQVHALPPNVTLEQGALCEPMSCILHGWNRLRKASDIRADSKILLLGAGIIGNLWMSLLHHFGQRKVIVSEPSMDRRTIAEGLDLGYIVTSPMNLPRLMPTTRFNAEEEGVDIIIDCTGVPAALEGAIPWTKMGATVLIFGCAPIGKPLKVCPEEIFAKELTILGTKINPFTFSEAVTLVGNMGPKYIDYEKLGIGVYSLDNYADALVKLKQGKISKIIFELDE